MKLRHKLFTLLLTVIICLTIILPIHAESVDTSVIRVLLSTSSSTSLTFTVNGSYSLKEDPSFTVSEGSNKVAVSSGKLKLTSGSKTYTGSTVTLVNKNFSGTSSTINLYNSNYSTNCSYLGDMHFSINNSKVRAINYIDLEQYLYGVVPYEMSNSFPVEALKSQAICARGYAIINRNSYANSRTYDILDTPQAQAYKGYVSSYTRAITAVDNTKGQVLTYKDKVIQTYYSASNGGQTEKTSNVWVADLPYYINQDDPYDIRNTSSLEELSFIPKTFDSSTISLMDDLVYDMLIAGAKSSTEAKDVTLVSTSSVTPHTPKYPSPSRCFTMADVTMSILADNKKKPVEVTVTISLNDLCYSSSNTSGIWNKKYALKMMGAEEGTKSSGSKSYEGYYLTNRRWGHGIGMSQRGAQQRASEGQKYTEILSFYFPGTALKTLPKKTVTLNLTSSKYTITTTAITGVAEGTSVKTFKKNLSANDDSYIVVNSSGKKKTSGNICTGDAVRVTFASGKVADDIPIIIYGDVNGDGVIGLEDLLKLQKHLLGTTKLKNNYALAADVSKDSTVDVLDLLKIQKHLLGTATIKQ